VREEIGGTYSPWPVSDASETFPGYGYLVANVDVDPATAEKISDLVSSLADDLATKGVTEDESEHVLAEQSHQVHDQELPRLSIAFSDDGTLLRKVAGAGNSSFAGLVEEGDKLYLMSLREMPEPKGVRVVTLRVEVTPEFLALIAPDLGAIQLNLTRKFEGGARQGILYTSGDTQYETTSPIPALNRMLHPSAHWIDPAVTGFSRLDAVYVGAGGMFDPKRPVLVTFNARPSRLNARIFASLGELSGSFSILFVAISVVFLLIEIAALITGVVMTRRITKAVSDLYAPVDGQIIEVNKAVADDPALVAADPYGKGWLIKIKMAAGAKVDHLLTAVQYEQQIAGQGH